MRSGISFGLVLSLVLMLVLTLGLTEKSEATWHNLLYETVHGAWGSWPWSIYGHPWAVIPGSGYSWGIVHELYHGTLNDQSLWCAGLYNGGITNLTPFLDEYPPNMNAKAVWGPFSLANAIEAECNFFYWNDTQYPSDYLIWGASLSPTASVVYEGGRASGPNPTNEWSNAVFHFSELVTTSGDTISLIGQSQVYLVFYFHSDNYLSGWGSFIDNIGLSWDDGLFDLYTVTAEFVQIEGGDTTVVTQLMEGEEYYSKLYWGLDGTGTTPMFDIDGEIDGVPMFHDRMSINVTGDTSFITYSDQPWSGDADQHTLSWTLDTNDEVIESSENNNIFEIQFEVVQFDSAPSIVITRPTEGDSANTGFWIQWEDYDRESDALIWLYYDTDGTGYNGTIITPVPLSEDSEEDSLWWNTSSLNNQSYYIYGFISDGFNPYASDYSDFPVEIYHSAGVNQPDTQSPVEFMLKGNYPNPFNGSTSIEYSTPEQALVQIDIYDVNGRLVENIFNGEKAGGNYTIDWKPSIGSGVYFCNVRMHGLKSTVDYKSTIKLLYIQ